MAEDDPLAKWRRPGDKIRLVSTTDAPPGTAALAPYKAFGEADAPPRVWLKRGAGGSDEGPAYGYLMNVGTDTWSLVHLVYSIPLVVVIRGECLEPLAAAFMKGTAAWVQVYEADRFIDPPLGEAIVREIEVHRTRPEEPADE